MQDREIVLKELNRRYELLEEEGYEIAFLAVYGSQNYDLDMNDSSYLSDIDCVAVVIPSYKDFIEMKQPVSKSRDIDIKEGYKGKIDIKDIRLYMEYLKKQRLLYLETLFTDYYLVSATYENIFNKLIENRENIAKINRKQLYDNIWGLSTKIYKSEIDTKDNLLRRIAQMRNKYNGKHLSHLVRHCQIISNLESDMSFKKALTYYAPTIDIVCKSMKKQNYNIGVAKMYASNAYNNMIDMISKSKYYERLNNNDEYVDLLSEVKTEIMKEYMRLELDDKVL